jgi:APA family basic amino acid/polyamine antiporter
MCRLEVVPGTILGRGKSLDVCEPGGRMEETSQEHRFTVSLQKELGFIDVFCIACGAMISSGIFILPGLAFAKTGPSVFFSYFIAGIVALIGTLSIAELSTAMPRAGGDYYFVVKSLGPMIGTVAGVLSWFAISLKSAFAVFGIAEIVHLTTSFNLQVSAVLIAVVFVALNVAGVRAASKLEVFLVIGLMGLMATYFALGISRVSLSRYQPFSPEGLQGILSTSGFVFISFGGLINIASIAEEVKNAKRTIPAALIASVLCITLLYTAVLFVTVGTLQPDALGSSLTPIADSAARFAGRGGYIIITIASLLAFVTTAIAGILSASRYPLALSRDSLFPAAVGRVTAKRNTPVMAVLLTGGLIIFSLFMRLELLVKAASTIILSSYVFTNLSVIILRESMLQNYRPSFRVPLYPIPQVLSVLLFIFLIADLGLEAFEIVVIFLVLSLAVYFLFGRRRAKREYALLHLVERITSKKLTTDALESELREIIRERDEIVFDRFDNLVQEAEILALEGPMELEPFFRSVSEKAAQRLQMKTETLFKALMEREVESSTAITPFAAVPHIVMEGAGLFHLVLVRCKLGVRFSGSRQSVKAVFILIGTKNERLFHLQALAAVAQILQDTSFEKRWMDAKGAGGLRDVLLLSSRKRIHEV